MDLQFPDKVEIENFKIEDNILKGIDIAFRDNPNIGEVVLDALNCEPNHIAQIDAETDVKTTFAEMKDRSVRCALWLEEQRIVPGDIIIVCSHNHLDTYVPVLATFYVGAVFNGWDHEISLKSACHLISFLKPKIIFSCESAIGILLQATKVKSVNIEIVVFGKYPGLRSLNDLLQAQSEKNIHNYRPLQIKNQDETAVLFLTSGSTGSPKSVMHSYKNFLKIVQTFSVYPLKDIILCNSTLYWITGIILIFTSTFTRGTRILHKNWNVEESFRIIEKYKVKRLFISPAFITHFCKSRSQTSYNLHSVEHVTTGGSKINLKILEGLKQLLPNALIIQIYGLTEIGRTAASQTENTKNFGSVGFVSSNMQMKILDVINRKTLGANQEGEICIKTSTIMTGYFKNPEETKSAIDEDGWLHTGDMGYYDDNGELIITGRYKDIIKCRDYQVSAAELEELLQSHPSVVEVAVVPVPHEIDIEQPMAFVKRISDVSESELVELSLVLGDRKKLRGGVEFLEDLPKTPSGKINKPLLKEMAKTLKNQSVLQPTLFESASLCRVRCEMYDNNYVFVWSKQSASIFCSNHTDHALLSYKIVVRIPNKIDIENFKIEKNILKGINIEVESSANIGEVILASLISQPNHIAQIDAETDESTTFAEMKDCTIRCALWMKEKGVKPGDMITICSHNHLNTYVPAFATFYVGAIFNGWDHELSLKSACYLMKFLKPKIIFACESAVDILLEAAKSENTDIEIIVFGKYEGLESLDDIMQIQTEESIRNYRPLKIENPEETATLFLTSGSTGSPKGVMHSYKNFLKLVQNFTVYPLKDVVLCNSTLYWLTGIMVILVSTFTRGTRIIRKKWDIEDGCRMIEKYKAKTLFLSPLMITHLCKLETRANYDFESVELVITGGSIIQRKILQELKQILPNAVIIPCYALTETGRMATSQTENTKNLSSTGVVAANTEIKIFDVINKNTLGANQEGEICIRQATIMTGYFKNPEETKKAIDDEGWLHTGDMGYYDDNGELIVTGRYKDVIKCRDYQMSPAELEEVLLSHPSVMEVAVVAIPHDIDVEQPMAFVKRSSVVSESELIEMSLVLGDHKKLRGGVEFLDEIPKTPSGKINKPMLRQMAKTLKEQRDAKHKTFV